MTNQYIIRDNYNKSVYLVKWGNQDKSVHNYR